MPSDAFIAWDWEGRIRPQILLAKGVGANTIKWSGGTRSVVDGRQTRTELHAHISQFIEYAADQGLYVYWSSHFYQEDLNPATDAATLDEIVAMMELVGSYENVIGNDCSNEINNSYTEADALALMQACYPAIKAVAPTLPLSISMLLVASDDWTQPALWSAGSLAQFEPYVDFWDMHPYYSGANQPLGSHLSAFRAASYFKPWFVGECGEEAAAGAAAQTARWAALDALSQQPDCAGVIGYTTQDADTRDYAMFADDGTERTHISTPFKNWPTTYTL